MNYAKTWKDSSTKLEGNTLKNEKFNREIKIITKDQAEILELKNTVNKMKNAIDGYLGGSVS